MSPLDTKISDFLAQKRIAGRWRVAQQKQPPGGEPDLPPASKTGT